MLRVRGAGIDASIGGSRDCSLRHPYAFQARGLSQKRFLAGGRGSVSQTCSHAIVTASSWRLEKTINAKKVRKSTGRKSVAGHIEALRSPSTVTCSSPIAANKQCEDVVRSALQQALDIGARRSEHAYMRSARHSLVVRWYTHGNTKSADGTGAEMRGVSFKCELRRRPERYDTAIRGICRDYH